ncbi:hypothetical protein [uncultured Paraglaciecola sp.]|uniref:hypothetical protein n=1 Tax=uncultured Paraglaciecola sp. TaxID=1765024 RepID=UPI00262BCA60|nr:hypothetical protein [uncultured Paraglaciecola sp.]
MNNKLLLKLANFSMLTTFSIFVICAVLAYGYESHFPLLGLTLLHVAQIVLAGFFKVSYVLRLVAQKQLGQALN